MAIVEKVQHGKYSIITTDASTGVWQYSMWIKSENKHFRQSLRTKNRDLAEDKAEELFYEIKHKLRNNRKVFSPSIKNACDMYIKLREKDLKLKTITAGRLGVIKGHVNHFLRYINKDTNIGDLSRKTMGNYHSSRIKKAKSVSRNTLLNEQATINAIIKMLWKEGYIHFDAFDFEKINKDSNRDKNRRDSFSQDEYKQIIEVLKEKAYKKNNRTEEQFINNNLFKYFCLILSNTGMRVGELRQLEWRDIKTYNKILDENLGMNKKGDNLRLVEISIRGETSKVRLDRTFVARNGQYFDKVRKLSKYTASHHRVFQNEEVFNDDTFQRSVRRRFERVLNKLEMADIEDRKLSLYSFRHYFVSTRVKYGKMPLFKLANSIGTSVMQIEKHYYHTDRADMEKTVLL
jgi:integrase